MPRAGDVIENPVTGETITFLRTSEDTGGAQPEVELPLRPDAFLPVEHVHPSQEEAFTVLEGAVRFSKRPGRRRRPSWGRAARPQWPAAQLGTRR